MSRDRQQLPSSVQKGYETRDANVRAVLLTGIGLGLVVAISLVIVGWAMDWIRGTPPKPESIPTVLLDGRKTITGPLLQEDPEQDLVQFQAAEAARLSSYGRDPQTQTIHIPIEKAMELALARGYPTRDNPGGMTITAPAGANGRATE